MSAAFAKISVQDAAILHKAYAPAALPTKSSPPTTRVIEKSQMLHDDSATHFLEKSPSIDRVSFHSIDEEKWGQKQRTTWSILQHKMRKTLALRRNTPKGQ